ncbi:MAG TPA: FAD-dependent oxidoreductase [Pyrinomonadaceae bacterium]|nr:FAD-dependent oxidoreductase [Pyrinomonadaceae bacterium]
MSNILILGAGFGGVIAAESLVKELGSEHQITLISRNRNFIFYPELVRLAFGKCEPDDIRFDVREAMLNHRVRFIEAEVARIEPGSRHVKLAHGEIEGDLSYDYLIIALGRRLATERVAGFFEYAQHLLSIDSALKFGETLKKFEKGRAVIGQCPGSRLPVPVYETAFALSRMFEEKGTRDGIRITIVSPDPPGLQFGDGDVALALRSAFDEHSIEYLPDFPIERIEPGTLITANGHRLNFSLLMLLPPFRGPGAVTGLSITDDEGYIKVDRTLKVEGTANIYAIGDCVNFAGPKLGHMAVQQAAVAAANVAAEIKGVKPSKFYDHELMLVIDEGGQESIYLHRGLWNTDSSVVKQGRFWTWAKRVHDKFWLAKHS